MEIPSKNAKKQLKPKKINQIKIGFLQKKKKEMESQFQ
jgi:hypothetical protein